MTRPASVDITVTRARRPWHKILGRVVLWIALLVVLVNGVQAIWIRATAEPAATTTPDSATTLDPGTASSVAGRVASDYLTFTPGATASAQSGKGWTGTGWMAPVLVIPGHVTTVDGTHAVVAVLAQVQVAMPVPASTTPATTTPAVVGVPTGFTDKGRVWLPLQVPVTLQDGKVTASPQGPVFSADPVTPPVTAQLDQQAANDTQGFVGTFFTAYAASDATTAYLTTTGGALQGLDKAVTYGTSSGWTLTLADPTGARTGTAVIGWTLTGVDLTTQQAYDVTVTNTGGRWFVSTVGPTTTPPQ